MQYDTFIFDVEGTLVDSKVVYEKVLSELLSSYNLPHRKNDLQASFAMTVEEQMDYIGIPDTVNNYQAKWEHLAMIHNADMQLFPGIFKMLNTLSDNVKLGIVTSQRQTELSNNLEALKILDIFQVIITADSTLHTKPHPLPLLTAINQLKSSPESTLYIGDSLTDESTAKAAHVAFGVALWDTFSNHNYHNYNYCFHTPNDVTAIFKTK